MGKKIIITEDFAKSKILNEEILLSQLPLDISQSLAGGTTPLSHNPAIPNDEFLSNIVIKQMLEKRAEIEEIIDNIDNISLVDLLSELIYKAQKKETPIRENLEKLCYEKVAELFKVPEGSTDFTIDLIDKVDSSITGGISIEPLGNSDYEYRDTDDIGNIESEVNKRKIINVLNMGAALYYTDLILSKIEPDDIITQELISLYKAIISINTYLLYTKEDIGITDKEPKQTGIVSVKLGNESQKNFIDVKAIIFPMLLTETIRGFMEIFSAHGLPEDQSTAQYILSQTDYIKAEPWNMRLGSGLWKKFISGIRLFKPAAVPYFYMKLSKLNTNNFNLLMSKIFGGEDADNIVNPVLQKALYDAEKEDFVGRMLSKQHQQAIITEKYINSEEL